ncbi:MAG: hypothetical protein HC879_18245 [Leptolyngbyaceae cyanobacterium SL_5_9]|nr:hypothetical protein [Leptolyngbyaceae cyanobacterium SL_5_9]
MHPALHVANGTLGTLDVQSYIRLTRLIGLTRQQHSPFSAIRFVAQRCKFVFESVSLTTRNHTQIADQQHKP